ncbi:MAG: hypothetical protein H7Z43_04060 [Clostridia bacterium]|nr:hypothetical protein [Deltaproteobacteria bacterium]
MASSDGQTASHVEACERLERWMPRAVRGVVEKLAQKGARAVLVGGGVRDAFLDREPPDWDVATDALPSDVAGWFPRVVRAGEKHGTIMVLTGPMPVEVTTFRGEGPYLDGRRPSHVTFLKDLTADLARRDLTINAIAYDVVAKTIVDPFDGESDLHAGVVRAVGDAAARFSEDGLRPLRALRFAATLGFEVEQGTRAALESAYATFARVAWERKKVEMEKLLGNGVELVAPVAMLFESGMLEHLAPELTTTRNVDQLLQLPRDAMLRLAGWVVLAKRVPQDAAAIVKRWRASVSDAERVSKAVNAFQTKPDPTSLVALRRWVSKNDWAAARDAATLEGLFDKARLTSELDALAAQKPPLAIADLAVDGSELESLGMRGPMVGIVLRQLLEKVLENPEINEKTTLRATALTLSTGIMSG